MSIEGIWTSEVYGAFGWENRGVFMLEGSRIIGGDNRAYAMGSYTFSGDSFTAELKVHYYGPPRTAFGEQSEEFAVRLDGKLENGVIDGTYHRPDKDQIGLQYRLTRRMDLPSE